LLSLTPPHAKAQALSPHICTVSNLRTPLMVFSNASRELYSGFTKPGQYKLRLYYIVYQSWSGKALRTSLDLGSDHAVAFVVSNLQMNHRTYAFNSKSIKTAHSQLEKCYTPLISVLLDPGVVLVYFRATTCHACRSSPNPLTNP